MARNARAVTPGGGADWPARYWARRRLEPVFYACVSIRCFATDAEYPLGGAAMESRTCPRCKLTNPASATRCDCGHDFASGRIEHSYLKPHEIRRAGSFVGGLALGFFLGCSGIGLVHLVDLGHETTRGAWLGFAALATLVFLYMLLSMLSAHA